MVVHCALMSRALCVVKFKQSLLFELKRYKKLLIKAPKVELGAKDSVSFPATGTM